MPVAEDPLEGAEGRRRRLEALGDVSVGGERGCDEGAQVLELLGEVDATHGGVVVARDVETFRIPMFVGFPRPGKEHGPESIDL